MFIMQMIVNLLLITYGLNGLFRAPNKAIMYLVMTIVGVGGIIIDTIVYKKNKKEKDNEISISTKNIK
jgi:hypothetical protein